MRYAIATLILAAALIALSETGSQAASCVTEDFSDLLKRAQCIVEVNIVSVKPEATSNLGIPRELANLKVLRCHKGNLEAGSVIECETFGGNDGKNVVVMPGQAKLVAGTKVLLLLTKVGDGPWRVLAGEAGVVEMYRDQTHAQIAQRAKGQFEYYVRDTQSLSGYTAVKSAAISTEQLGKLVQVVLTTGRPVFENVAESKTVAAPVKPIIENKPAPTAEHSVPFGKIAIVLGLTSLAWLAIRRKA